MISPVFQRMLSAAQIEDQVRDSLQLWFPTYLREIERQIGVPAETYPAPVNYSNRNSFDYEPPELLPKILVIAPGIIGSPTKTGENKYIATWRIGIGIAVDGRNEAQSNAAVKSYAAAARGIMLQNSNLIDLGMLDITWTEEAYDDLPIPSPIQIIKAASLLFDVTFGDTATRGGGPTVPDQPDYEYGQVQTVDITIEKEVV